MLRRILEEAALRPEFCASLLRVPLSEFTEWLDEKRPVPRFAIRELASVLGVSEDTLSGKGSGRDESIAIPPLWCKLRDDRLIDSDRELIALIRRLAHFLNQLEVLRSRQRTSSWEYVFESARAAVDRAADPAEQGRQAAIRFREVANLAHGQTGIGELIRPRLRQLGLLLIESPLPKSSLEGCAFNANREGEPRPCVFANTYKSTWFRRNEILLHEVGHAIFDLQAEIVPLDFKDDTDDQCGPSESRARAFAQETLVPKSVLIRYQNQFGINWDVLNPEQLAHLVANIHAEQRTVLRAALDAGLISPELFNRYCAYDLAQLLPRLTSHALPTHEYLARLATTSPIWRPENRNTTVGLRPLRLPVAYVDEVLKLAANGTISTAKAAEMLMTDRYTLQERFATILATQEAA